MAVPEGDYSRCDRRRIRALLGPDWGTHLSYAMTIDQVTEMVLRAVGQARLSWRLGERYCDVCGQRHSPVTV